MGLRLIPSATSSFIPTLRKVFIAPGMERVVPARMEKRRGLAGSPSLLAGKLLYSVNLLAEPAVHLFAAVSE